ncbi:hypothetical protein [Burkholderia gladioli]|uniref:hypothetical protein n=1 Tax=Burkholderia gladioli TaxID=28095 RepID=UPI001C278436|nr:hypothetical protein [Burkholderia gladioli]MBU9383528.1 hypothetical protein [Burkholderia gladioli]
MTKLKALAGRDFSKKWISISISVGLDEAELGNSLFQRVTIRDCHIEINPDGGMLHAH